MSVVLRGVVMYEGNARQELWQFDVNVTRRGWFSVMAEDEIEAKAKAAEIIENGTLNQYLVHWGEPEVGDVD